MMRSLFVVVVALIVLGCSSVKADTVVKATSFGRTVVVSDSCTKDTCTTPVVRYRYARPLLAAPVVVAAPVAVESKQPEVKIIEQPRTPFVIRGMFTDRVRFPRGKSLSVVTE
jgi:hypothetical protein